MSKPKREYTTEFKQKAVEPGYARGYAAEVCRAGAEPLGIGTLAQGGKKIRGERFSRKGKPQTYRRTKGDSRTKEKTEGRGDRARYPKKGDSHLLLGRQEKYRFIKHHRLKFPASEDVQNVEGKQKWVLQLVGPGPFQKMVGERGLDVGYTRYF